ncbi:MAG: hypothetical protein LBH25_10580 [Fibromonadaceae bacterium]|jgi:hypothetical protein|nr:hypothetical protein [Fibromonadaceae bacterium]
MIKILIIFLVMAKAAFSQSLSVEGGMGYFLGSLQKEIKAYPYAGGELEYELSNYTALYLQGTLSYLKLKSNTDFHGLYQFLGRAGIETPEHLLGPAAIGIGVSMATIRGRDKTPEAQNYMLSTSETEFGWHVHLELNLFKFEKFRFGTRFHYDEIWTNPKNSSLVQGGIYASYYI